VLGAEQVFAWTYIWHNTDDSEYDRAAQKGFFGQRAVWKGVRKRRKREG